MPTALSAFVRDAPTLAFDSTHPRRPPPDAPGAAPGAASVGPHDWANLNQALAATGGIVSADELAELMRRHCGQGLSQVARWLVAGDLLSLRFQAQTQVPLFQFDLRDMSLRHAVQDVAAELRGVIDGDELTRWFAEANSWLGGAAPADQLGLDTQAVLAAARADRFIVTGWA